MPVVKNPFYDPFDINSDEYIVEITPATPVGEANYQGGTEQSNQIHPDGDGGYYNDDAQQVNKYGELLTGGAAKDEYGQVIGEGRASDVNSDFASTIKSLANSLGLTKPNGDYNLSKILGLGAGAAALGEALNRQPGTIRGIGDMVQSLPSNAPPAFTAAQMATFSQPMLAGSELQRSYAADMPSAIRPGQKFADGGMVEGPLSQLPMVGMVTGEGGGQDDLVDAQLSPGEYVMDAESVAMLGDGDNAAGARKLDELRQQLRAHKRSAPDDEIAPPAMGPLSYIGAK